jgi:hypothetical protein
VTVTLNQPTRHYLAYDAFLAEAQSAGWSDGLPIVPATPARVTEFLDVVGLAAAEIVGSVPSRDLDITAEHVAINAVMAGCRPEYMPVVLSAVRGHLDPMGNSHCVTATLTGASQLVIVNGPVRQTLGISCGEGAFGPGSRANATIGRAVRLVVRNACQNVPGDADRAAFSSPNRYSFCFGEDEESTSWTPLHVQRGFAGDSSATTLYSMTDMFALYRVGPKSPEELLNEVSHLARCRPINADRYLGDTRGVVIVVGPEHRHFLEGAGWSKADVQEYLFPRLSAPHTREAERQGTQGDFALGGPLESSFDLSGPERVLLVAAGGAGSDLTWVLYPHIAAPVTYPVVT